VGRVRIIDFIDKIGGKYLVNRLIIDGNETNGCKLAIGWR